MPSAFFQIVSLLNSLNHDEKLQLIAMISDGMREVVVDPEKVGDDSLGKQSSRRYLPRLPQMVDWGLIRPEDQIHITGIPDHPALLLDAKRVAYKGQAMSINEWAKKITGWTTVNIYARVILVRDGRTLDEIRRAYLDEQGFD